MNPEILTNLAAFHPDCASFNGLWLLALLGRAGTAGHTTGELIDATSLPPSTARKTCEALAAAGLAISPSRDTGRGRCLRHTISPAGLALLQTPAHTAQPKCQPLKLKTA
jgi:DNA-binding MarR family transcriptional regulator